MGRHLLNSISAIAFSAFATTAAAQAAPAATDQAKPGVASIAEVVVTASRKAENVQREALAIQALTSESLTRANVSRPEDLSVVAPGLSIGTGGNYPQAYIRGVGNYATQAYAEGAVAFNLDGVYISRAWATRGMFYDLDRVEVVKGPQGTLYGRNASGGAINVITAKPKLSQTSGFAELQAGDYDDIRGSAAINVPLGDTVAVRVSGQVVSHAGYLSDGYNDEKTQSGRVQLLWRPTDAFSLLLEGNYQHLGGKGAGTVVNPQLPGDAFRGSADPAVTAIFRAEPGIGPLEAVPRKDGFIDGKIRGFNAEANWDLGFATLTFIPAYRDSTLRDRNYVPGFRIEDNEHDRQTSAELRLGNSIGHFKWVVGGYFFNEHQTGDDGLPLQLVDQGIDAQIPTQMSLQTRSYAGFGQGTYSLTDRLRLTAGLRYTYEHKTMDGVITLENLPNQAPPPVCGLGTFNPTPLSGPPLFCSIGIPVTGELSQTSTTYKAGVEFDVAPRSMAFANISTGFKSGGFFQAPTPNSFRPEKLTAIEVGIKNRFLDNRLQFNVEAFHWNYRDHQESYVGPTSFPGYFAFITTNAGRAKSYGVEADVIYLATPNDEIDANIQYNKSNYDTFQFQSPSAIFGPPITGCSVSPMVNGFQTVDCSGKQLIRAPTWTGTVAYRHTFDLGEHGRLTASADTQFSSSSYLSIDFLKSVQQRAYAVGNFDLTYAPPAGRWTLTAFVHNVSNEVVMTQTFRSPFVSPANPLANPDGLVLASVRPPRTIGARIRFDF